MNKNIFLVVAGLSLSLLTNDTAAQEFKIKELEHYLKQSPTQVAAAFKSKNFVFEKRDERFDTYGKRNAKANYMFSTDNRITAVGWREPIAAQPKILADLKAANYMLKNRVDREQLHFFNAATGLTVIFGTISLTKEVYIMVGKNG